MMSSSELSPEHVSSLIEQVLKAKDPATVGLKRILRKKEDERGDFPLQGAVLREFSVSGSGPAKLSDEERRVLELEKQVADLQIALKKQQQNAVEATSASFVKGKAEGIAEGRQQGMTETTVIYEQKIDALQEHVAEFLQQLETARRSVFGNAEHLLLKLCCSMVEKIIDREVSVHPDIILGVLKRALMYIGQHEKMIIRISPDDAEQVAGRRDFWIPVGERLADITIEPDPRIGRGGCIVESNAGLVDARLGVQFEELAGLVEKTWNEILSAPLPEKAAQPPASE